MVTLKKVHESPYGEKAVVLWASRHPPLRSQIRELESKLGPIVVYQLSGVIPNAEYLLERARELRARYVVPVLPLSFIAVLAELARRRGLEVLYARMRTVEVATSVEEAEKAVAEAPDRRVAERLSDGSYRVFEFERFERLIRVELVTEPL